jgi:hypothetical protein
MTRVEIPAYTDSWMKGDRYGEIVKITRRKAMFKNRWDEQDIAHVKLDISGKTIRVILDDCTEG